MLHKCNKLKNREKSIKYENFGILCSMKPKKDKNQNFQESFHNVPNKWLMQHLVFLIIEISNVFKCSSYARAGISLWNINYIA